MSFAPYCGKLELEDRTHLWCEMEDGTIEVVEMKTRYLIHADVFGAHAWTTLNRGYYFADKGVVSTHGAMEPALEHKLERKFKEAPYFSDESNYCL